MAKSDYQAPGLSVSTTLMAIADITARATDDADDLAAMERALTAAGQVATTWEGRQWSWARATAYFKTHTKTVAAAASSGAQRTSNVSTITTTAVHGLQAGQLVKLASVSDSTFDGIFVVASAATTTTFTYKQAGDDVAAATAGTGTVYVLSYPLRSVDVAGAVTATDASKVAIDCGGVKAVHYDNDRPLSPMTWDQYQSHIRIYPNYGATQPTHYCVHDDPPYLYLWPPPASAYNLYVAYIKQHSKITNAGSNDAALMVPPEFHYQVYVDGAVWLLKHGVTDGQALYQSDQFREAMRRMTASAPDQYDDRAEWPMTIPGDRFTVFTGDGVLISNDVSV